MFDNLTPDQKREYLRLLLADGQETATAYLQSLRKPTKWIFYSNEEVEEYYRKYREETGDQKEHWAIVLHIPRTEEEADAFFQKKYSQQDKEQKQLEGD